jgi:hypothetical protein
MGWYFGADLILWVNPVGRPGHLQNVKSDEAVHLCEVYFKGSIVYPPKWWGVGDFELSLCHIGSPTLLIVDLDPDPPGILGILGILSDFRGQMVARLVYYSGEEMVRVWPTN